jgi:arylsulfatase A-like enzyme
MIANIDQNVGQLREFLATQGLERDTIFIFTTDNGTAGGDKVFNAGMRGKKGSPFDGGHRVPLFLSWPGKNLDSGHDMNMLCHAIDVLPTLIDLCGIPAPADVRFRWSIDQVVCWRAIRIQTSTGKTGS